MNKRIACSLLGLASIIITTAYSPLSAQWQTSGNTVTSTDVLGATNTADLSIITNNIERLRVTASGTITTTNNADLVVNGGNLTANSGLISLAGAASVDIIGSGGPLTLTSNGGPLDLISNGGQLALTSNGGPFDLASYGGPFTLTSYGGPLDITSNGGGVNVNLGSGLFTINGDVQVNGNGTYSGTWVSSDARFKTNILQLDNALAKVMNLRGVNYDYRYDQFPTRNFPQGRQIGFIAQEVEKVVPEAVRTGADGYKAVAYQNLTALLTEAIKEQQAEIQLLQAKVANLEAALGKQNQPLNIR